MVHNTSRRDLVLPVPMTDLQNKVTSAVVSSNFSEILSFFDGTEQSQAKYQDKLKRMMTDLNRVAVHPYLLLTHLEPSLSVKRAPQMIETMSGAFQVLVSVAKRLTDPRHNIAVVCEAGHTTDLVDLVLSDRALNVTRYSAPPVTKLYKKEIVKRRGATFHLIPSVFEHLMQAVYAAFDLIIVLGNDFDVNSDYGTGLRAQLRDPNITNPLAPVLRLVCLNSAQHIELIPYLTFADMIATTVVQKKHVGAIPPFVRQFYVKELSGLQSFFTNPESPYPLPALERLKIANQKDVERSLYLDDEDQYQVDFANGKNKTTRRKAVLGAPSGGDAESEDDESASDDVKPPSYPSADGDAVEHQAVGPTKRRRVELEDGTLAIIKELSVENPLTLGLLTHLNELLASKRRVEEELAEHRQLASERELEIERSREFMHTLALKVRDLEKYKMSADRRLEKLRTRNEKMENDAKQKAQWWEKLTADLKLTGTEETRVAELSARLRTAEERVDVLTRDLSSEKSRFQQLQMTSSTASVFSDQLAEEKAALVQENADLKAQISDAPTARVLALQEQLRAKENEANAVRVELRNLEESVKRQITELRSFGHGTRGDRRFRGGRGGRWATA